MSGSRLSGLRLSARFWLSSTTVDRHFPAIFFVGFCKNILGLLKQNSLKYRISKDWELCDRETRLFGAVSSRRKEWGVEVPPNNRHRPVRSFWAKACSPEPCTQPALVESNWRSEKLLQSIEHPGSWSECASRRLETWLCPRAKLGFQLRQQNQGHPIHNGFYSV